MSSESLARLDLTISALKKRLENATHIRAILEADPELAVILAEPNKLIDKTGGSGHKEEIPKQAAPTRGGPAAQEHFQQVARFLRASGNEWTFSEDIGSKAGIDHNQWLNILYKTHCVMFEKRKSPVSKRKLEVRLKEKATVKEGDEDGAQKPLFNS